MPDDAALPAHAAVPAPETLADVLERVEHDGERVALIRDGRPVAVLVPVDEAEFLRAWEDAHDASIVARSRAEYARSGQGWRSMNAQDFAAEFGIDAAADGDRRE